MKTRLAFALDSEKNQNWMILIALVASTLFSILDMSGDIDEGANWLHLGFEVFIIFFTLGCILVLWNRNKKLNLDFENQKKMTQIAEHLKNTAMADSVKWREEAASAVNGLSAAIDLQLTRWNLTAAEKEVALLLLKGLSLKEIADVRSVSEKTARTQSFSIYAKSGLNGRAQLSAFFLEDLMVPAYKISTDHRLNNHPVIL